MEFLIQLKEQYLKELSSASPNQFKLESLTTLIAKLSDLEFDKERQVDIEKNLTSLMTYLTSLIQMIYAKNDIFNTVEKRSIFDVCREFFVTITFDQIQNIDNKYGTELFSLLNNIVKNPDDSYNLEQLSNFYELCNSLIKPEDLPFLQNVFDERQLKLLNEIAVIGVK